MKLILPLFAFFSISICVGQTSTITLDLNDVKARLTNGGVLFNNTPANIPAYEVPEGSQRHAIFAAAFWFAGIDQNGVLRTSAPTYDLQSDIFSGPYSSTNEYSDPDYTADFATQIAYVQRWDIQYHIQHYQEVGYVLPVSLANWPANGNSTVGMAENLAPFIDMNGDNLYDPMDGDYPDIRGDAAAYIIMNDAANTHTQVNGEPMGIEVHIMAYQYATNDYLHRTTFLNVRVFNRGNYSYENFKMGIFMDGDLGNYSDDYSGCLSSKNVVFTYNADNNDEDSGGSYGYTINPPSVGVVSLKEPFSSSGHYNSTSVAPNNLPTTDEEVWNAMNARWTDGSPWSSNFLMDGNPYTNTGINEVAASNPPGDRRMVMSMDSVQLLPGQTTCQDFAIVYNRRGSNLESVQGVIELADSVKQFYDSQILYNCNQVTLGLEDQMETTVGIHPNPNKGEFTIDPGTGWSNALMEITDLNGRVIQSFEVIDGQKISVSLSERPGVYLVTIRDMHRVAKSKVVIGE